ncbi:MAG: response regulator transcription factor [Prevotellaceae bacterium]|jgi:DNA-binding NarL/FixJ family response regulator|nr:response regulator transcription factor [Prevotellaceae bacterium]
MDTKNNSHQPSPDPQLIRVAIADDHKMVVAGLKKLINETSDTQVIGIAYSIAECRDMLKDVQPDVLLLDVSMPDGNGIDLCPKIKAKYPSVKVLMLTSYGELATVSSALDAGADGYVLKNSMPEEIMEGIRQLASGQRFLCGEVDLMLKTRDDNPMELTRRECNLLRLIAEGCSNAEIAERLNLGYETIKSYRKNLYIKLGAHSTKQLIQRAMTLRLV